MKVCGINPPTLLDTILLDRIMTINGPDYTHNQALDAILGWLFEREFERWIKEQKPAKKGKKRGRKN
jgi:hypothetical protein